jgi:hypothetical protein
LLIPQSNLAPAAPNDTLVLVQKDAGGNFTTYYLPHPPPYFIATTNLSGETSIISGVQNGTPGYTTQIDFLPPNIVVKEGPNEQVIPAGNLQNVTISSGFQYLNFSTFSEIRVVPANLVTKSPSPTPSPSSQNGGQSLQDSISANPLAYTGYLSSFIGIGYFARDIALRIKRLV